jgi:hypothetical protein
MSNPDPSPLPPPIKEAPREGRDEEGSPFVLLRGAEAAEEEEEEEILAVACALVTLRGREFMNVAIDPSVEAMKRRWFNPWPSPIK